MSLSSQPNTIGSGGKRNWIYAAEIKGKYQKLRYFIATFLLIIFYIGPWLSIDGNSLVRLGFVSNEFFLFGIKLFPTELYHFLVIGLLLALTLFLTTNLFGRVWCGYACPQTVYIEILFGKIEQLIEGRASKRKLLASQDLSLSKFFKKTLKFLIFALISLSFGITFVSYFASPIEVLTFSNYKLGIFVFILSAAAFFDGAYWKEQFCHIVCPYARFQSIMLSKNSVTVGYDKIRGEPRKKGKDRTDAGDCVDCGLCVQVCPSGIDIREGIGQQECTACAKCVDACDKVMTSLGRKTGLIRYDTENNLTETYQKRLPVKYIRPLSVALSSILICLAVFGSYQLLTRPSFHALFLSAPGQTYVREGERVKHLYTVRLRNQSRQNQIFKIQSNDGVLVEKGSEIGPIKPGEEGLYPVLVSYNYDGPVDSVFFTVSADTSAQSESFKIKVFRPSR